MITRDELETAYFKAHTSQLYLYCDKADRDKAMVDVISLINTPADSMTAGTMMDYPRTLDYGVTVLDQLLRASALRKFVSVLTLDEIVPLLKTLKKTTFEGKPVIALSSSCILRLSEIVDEWNAQHDGEGDKQIYLEPSNSW